MGGATWTHTAFRDDGVGGGGVESIGWNLFNYGREAGGGKEGEGGGASQEVF